jgi:hypothetical protein
VALGDQRVVEIAGPVAPHPQLFHDADGAQILGNGEGHDLAEPRFFESVAHRLTGALGGQPPTPELRAEAPADLHARRKMRCEARHREPDEARQFAGLDQFGGPQSEAMFREVRFHAIDAGVAFGPRQAGGEEQHHPRVGVDAVERFAIIRPPTAEKEARGGKRVHR